MSIRVILLEKKSSLKQGCFDDKPKYKDESIDGPWIALGHFDAIYTFKLGNDKDDVFKNIERTNTEIIPSLSDTVSSYYYPLYLIEKEGDDDRELWEREDPYIAVVRIHFSESVNISKMKEELINDVSYDKNTIGFHFYHTIELSDFILILRSSSMSEILNCALKLRKNILIGKVYTYCGIDLKHIKKLFEDNDVADNSMENNIAEKDKIQLFAMRFSVRDFKNAQDIVNGVVKILKKNLESTKPYFIVGVDDIIVNSNNVPVKNIMKLFYDWFIRNFKTGNLFSYSEEVFYDVTTRVGVNFEEIDGIEERTATNAQILCHICERVKNKDENVQKKIGTEKYKKYRWLHAFSELTKTMERMSKTVIMDELVYLILPSVNALWEILENHIKDKGNIAFSEDEVSNIQNYVENLENLMEHILRFEGQLTQNPETRPILYDMPVTMLEYTLALLSECNKILCDAKETQAISYLIVPRFCQRIEAQEIFYATNDSPGLVIISIPLHMMYDSRTIQATLCHEVAHFVVTPHRKLDERVKYFATATAILIAKVVFNTYNRDFINKIRDDLQNIFTKENSKHISQMQDKVIQWLKKLVYNYENYSNFISEFLLNVKDLKDLKISANLDDFKYRFNHDFLQLFIKEMRNFFREIFADICMFILRETNPEAYIDDLVKDINKGSTLSDDSPYEQFAIRIYVCLDACGKEIPECPKDASAEKIMLYQYLSNIKKNIKETKEPKNAIIPMGVIKQLIKYSKECYNSLTLSLDESEDSAKCLRDFKKKNGDNVTYEHLEEIIDNYRKFILDTMGEEA